MGRFLSSSKKRRKSFAEYSYCLFIAFFIGYLLRVDLQVTVNIHQLQMIMGLDSEVLGLFSWLQIISQVSPHLHID